MKAKIKNNLLELKEKLNPEHIIEHTSIFKKFGKDENPEEIKENLCLWIKTWILPLIDDSLNHK